MPLRRRDRQHRERRSPRGRIAEGEMRRTVELERRRRARRTARRCRSRCARRTRRCRSVESGDAEAQPHVLGLEPAEVRRGTRSRGVRGEPLDGNGRSLPPHHAFAARVRAADPAVASCARSPACRSSSRSRSRRRRARAASAPATRRRCSPRARSGPLRLPKFGSAIGRLRIEPPVDDADQRLRHVVDDRAAARRSGDDRDAPDAVVGDRRRHRRARPLAALRRGSRPACRLLGHEREVGELVVEQEAACVISRLPNWSLDRRRHRHRVAVAVDDRDVRRRRQVERGVARARGLRGGGGRAESPGVARRMLASARISADRARRYASSSRPAGGVKNAGSATYTLRSANASRPASLMKCTLQNEAGSIAARSKRSSIFSICSTVRPPDDGSGKPQTR